MGNINLILLLQKFITVSWHTRDVARKILSLNISQLFGGRFKGAHVNDVEIMQTCASIPVNTKHIA